MVHPSLVRRLVPLALASSLLAAAAPAQSAQREITLPGKSTVARVWSEPGPAGAVPHYSLSLDGERFSPAKATHYDLLLRYERFDPLARTVDVPARLRAGQDNRLMIVQYWTQGVEDYRASLRELGAQVHLFLANHANVVEMDRATAAEVARLPFVRAVVPFHPAFRLEEELLQALRDRRQGDVTVNVLVMRRGGHAPVAEWVEQRGGSVEHVSRETYLMTVELPYEELPGLASLNSVQWVDRWGPPETDMDIARNFGNANYVEQQTGFLGEGVRIEVMDGGTEEVHPDLQNFIVHSPNNTVSSHGTCTSGIVLGSGAGNFNARGILPQAFLSIADYSSYSGGSRYNHSGELADPFGPYRCVLQSNSWGSPRTTNYTSVSQDMDLILFDFPKLTITQSQSNSGGKPSRPQAWAKNIVAVGGIRHKNTLTRNDDSWTFGASTGPAADLRVKPDLASFYDLILCTDRVGSLGYSGNNYYGGFGGTSGATPIVAGYFGLFYEMWHKGIWEDAVPGATVHESAPFNTTAKALVINTATQWDFFGEGQDLGRARQGWGHPDAKRMLDLADQTIVIDETDVLSNLQSTTYQVDVEPGAPAMKATMVYRDPPGTTSSSLHRINDLDLTATSPSGDVYHGNVGLLFGTWSVPGGNPNPRDTVENVFVQNPEPGTWQITVTASEINQDAHVETPLPDADYALVVSGVTKTLLQPPAAPSNLSSVATRRAVILTWTDNATGEDGFSIERSEDGVVFDSIGTVGPNETFFRDRPLLPGTTYYHRVQAFNQAGSSSYTNVTETTTLGGGTGGGTNIGEPTFP